MPWQSTFVPVSALIAFTQTTNPGRSRLIERNQRRNRHERGLPGHPHRVRGQTRRSVRCRHEQLVRQSDLLARRSYLLLLSALRGAIDLSCDAVAEKQEHAPGCAVRKSARCASREVVG